MTEQLKLKEQRQLTAAPRKRAGMVLVGAGVLMLILNGLNISIGSFLWPLFIVAPGLFLLLPASQLQPEQRPILAYLAIPGAMLVAIGGILFAQNMVNYFESWAYAWALLPIAAVLGLRYAQRFQDGDNKGGEQFVRVMLWVFVGFMAFFEIVVFGRLGEWWPLLLVAGGGWLLLRTRREQEMVKIVD